MKKFSIGIFLIILVISQSLVGCATNDREIETQKDREIEAQKYFEQADTAWKVYKIDLAFEYYNRAIELNPNLADAYIGRSVLYAFASGGGESNKAWQDCERALQLNPNSARAYRLRSYLNYHSSHNETNKLNQALADVNKAIEIDPNYLDAYEVRANIYSRLGNYEKAIEDYTHILTYPNFRSSSYMKYYDFDRTSDWAWYADWDQRTAALLWNRGDAFYNYGAIDNAIEDLDNALKLSPNNSWLQRSQRKLIAERDRQNAS